MMHDRAKQHLDDYQEGNISWQELANSLILMSIDVDPSEYFDELSEDLKESLGGLSSDPSDHFIIGSICMNDSHEEVQGAVQVANRRSFDAHWRMRRYVFGNDLPSV